MPDTKLLIIGAGPFGLALAAHAHHHGLEYTMLGEPMAFWKSNMPRGMLLRSTCDWHLDPAGVDTIDAYLDTTGRACAEVEPLSLDFYLGYTDWSRARKSIRPAPGRVRRLDRQNSRFVATLDSGEAIGADNVVVAVGLRHFAYLPAELERLLPPGSYGHTCHLVDLDALRDRRCLIIGGRQSAFEWAALLVEAGAAAVDVCYRHDTPRFEVSDWSWVPPLVDRTNVDAGWYRKLSEEEKDSITRRLWEEGRAKLEPWLAPRIAHEAVRLWPRTKVRACEPADGSAVRATLDSGHSVVADRVILATGYGVDMSRVPLLRDGNLWDGLRLRNGYPELDESLQTSHAGLFITGQPAVQDFGPFFGFTVAVRASAERIGHAMLR